MSTDARNGGRKIRIDSRSIRYVSIYKLTIPYMHTSLQVSANTYGIPNENAEAALASATFHQSSDDYAGPDEALLSLLPALAQCSHPLNVSLNETEIPSSAIECHCEDRSACRLPPSQCKVTCPDRDRHIREALLCEAVSGRLDRSFSDRVCKMKIRRYHFSSSIAE